MRIAPCARACCCWWPAPDWLTALVLGVLMVGAVRNLYDDLHLPPGRRLRRARRPDASGHDQGVRARPAGLRRTAAELRPVRAAHRPLPGVGRRRDPRHVRRRPDPLVQLPGRPQGRSWQRRSTTPTCRSSPRIPTRSARCGSSRCDRCARATGSAGWLMVVSRSADLLDADVRGGEELRAAHRRQGGAAHAGDRRRPDGGDDGRPDPAR